MIVYAPKAKTRLTWDEWQALRPLRRATVDLITGDPAIAFSMSDLPTDLRSAFQKYRQSLPKGFSRVEVQDSYYPEDYVAFVRTLPPAV
jgi:hypothetical protein